MPARSGSSRENFIFLSQEGRKIMNLTLQHYNRRLLA